MQIFLHLHIGTRRLYPTAGALYDAVYHAPDALPEDAYHKYSMEITSRKSEDARALLGDAFLDGWATESSVYFFDIEAK